jgi:hypothetical protein
LVSETLKKEAHFVTFGNWGRRRSTNSQRREHTQ